MAILLSTALAAASAAAPAHAADPELVAKLAPAIAKQCRTGVISARDLAEAIAANALPDLKPELTILSGPRAIASRAFDDQSGPNRAAFTRLRRITETWIDPADPSVNDYLPPAAGGVTIVERDGTPVLKGRGKEVLTALLEGDDSRFAFRCSDAAAPSEPAPIPVKPAPRRNPAVISIARSPDDLALPLSKKSFAELSFLSDEVADEQSFSIHATAGISWGELTPFRREPGKPGIMLRAIPSAFVQFEREGIGGGDAVEDVDNLNFGGQVSGFLQTRNEATRSHYYALSARFLSDSHFESSAWSAALSLTPEIPMPGNDQPYDLVRDKVELSWLATGVADYFNVDDPGDKSEWLTAPEYARLGFDLSGKLRFLLGESRNEAISFIGDYRFREELGSGVGDARLLSLKLMFEPSARYAFGIAFDRGRNLDTLEFAKTWKITLGLKR